jgi:hypothetical protein
VDGFDGKRNLSIAALNFAKRPRRIDQRRGPCRSGRSEVRGWSSVRADGQAEEFRSCAWKVEAPQVDGQVFTGALVLLQTHPGALVRRILSGAAPSATLATGRTRTTGAEAPPRGHEGESGYKQCDGRRLWNRGDCDAIHIEKEAVVAQTD